eukprot:1910352-Amphidinium_carterae.1
MKEKSHKDAVRKGFPTYTHRCFERPVYKYQQAAIGLGPMDRERAFRANEYLDMWNAWSRTAVQGPPIASIGVVAANFAEEDGHQVFINESGLVRIHMPWIIGTAYVEMDDNLSINAHQTPF